MTRWFKYEPIVPCRPNVFGEGIFVEHWQREMRRPVEFGDNLENEYFVSIISPLEARASDAAVASSFICWLGTNVGRGFLHRAGEIAKKLVDRDDAFALAWANWNQRVAGMNHDRRTIEAIVPESHLDTRAIEVVEIIARWLGTPRGQTMIKAAEAEISETHQQLLEQQQMKWRAQERAEALLREKTA